MNLNFISGTIYTFLGLCGATMVLFNSGAAVTWPFIILGVFGFVSLFAYGFSKALAAYFGTDVDFQINN